MGEIWSRRQLTAMGWSKDRLATAVGTGELVRVAHGVYSFGASGTEWERYRLRVQAAAMISGSVVSHESAAALHDLPFLRPQRDHVHFTVDRTSGGGRRRGIHLHPHPLEPSDVTVVDGIRVTTRTRTAIDIATMGDLERAVCAIDAARLIRRRPARTDPEPIAVADLAECLRAVGRRRGLATAQRALALSVDCSESAGESWSRMQILSLGLPAPELQRRHLIDGAVYFADFDWGPMTGEFDGRGKYGCDAAAADLALDDEKRRHAAFAAAGIEVVRWGWRELSTPGRLGAILVSAMDRNGLIPATA